MPKAAREFAASLVPHASSCPNKRTNLDVYGHGPWQAMAGSFKRTCEKWLSQLPTYISTAVQGMTIYAQMSHMSHSRVFCRQPPSQSPSRAQVMELDPATLTSLMQSVEEGARIWRGRIAREETPLHFRLCP